jgi:hypothetical protein
MVSPRFLIRVKDGPTLVCLTSGGLTGTVAIFFSYSKRVDSLMHPCHEQNSFSLVCSPFLYWDLICRRLMLNPRDRKSGDENEYVSLKLVLARVSERSHTVAEATFKFLIYDQSYGKHYEEHQGALAPWSSSLRFTTGRLLD